MSEQLTGWSQLWAPFADEWRFFVSIVLIVVAALIARSLATRVTRRFFLRISDRTPSVEEKRRVETVGRIVRQSLSVLIVTIAGLIVLNQFGVAIAPILGAAGVAGIAIGFGAQSLVKDFFAGFFLLVENQIRVGDVVEIAGKSGVVESLSLRRTKLRAYDGNVHYVSNGLITTVTNMSTEFAFAVVDMRVSYRDDIDRVFLVMRETADALRRSPGYETKVLGEIEIAGVDDLGESAMTIRARLKTPPLDQWSVRREFLKRLKEAFQREGFSVPFPHRTIHTPDDAQPTVARPLDDRGERTAPAP